MNLPAHAINGTLQLAKVHKIHSHFVHGVIGISPSISEHTSQNLHHIQFILTIFGKEHHFSTETHGNVIFPYKVKKDKGREPKGELIRLSDFISQDYSNDKTDLSSSIKISFVDSQPSEYLK